MATVTSPEPRVDDETFIDGQIGRTSFQVKTVDLVAGLILLGLVVLGSVFAIVLVDHWIVGLGFAARLLSLILISLASLCVAVSKVFYPLIRSVNPEYAALTVERSFPDLKNALSSFLFFRERPEILRESIFAGLRRQVAVDLSQVPMDAAVDRSPIIKWGYALVAVAAIWCGYILFSPKDPLQTVRRVLLPWQEIARPSQVDILAVRPGDVEIFRGQTIAVQAEVQGLRPDDRPWIEYSTLDGQVVAQRLPLAEDGIKGHFVGELTTGDAGIFQDLQYRVLAGDAVSRTYDVVAREAPHIQVDRLEYQFPAYTELPAQTVSGFGDIRALEGTRVTVVARANQPMRTGHIELLPPVQATDAAVASRQAPLIVDDRMASVRFALRLDAERKQSLYRAYRLHFINQQGLPSVDPVEHTIEVTPDLKPIVELLTPTKRTLEIPENGWQRIEVRAVDPDFQLTKVTLAARTRDRTLLGRQLLEGLHRGQFTARFDFVPREFNLKDGDVVEYLAAAEDNRHSPLQGKLAPNRSVSWTQVFRIVKADPLAEEPPQPNAPAQPTPSPDGEETPEEAASSQQRQDNPNAENSATPPPDGQESPPESTGQDESGDAEPSESGSSSGESGLQQDGGSGENAQREELDSGQTGDSSSQESSREGAGNQTTESQGENQGSDSPAGNETSGDTADNGSPQGDGGREGSGELPPDPLPSTGERDGEVIDRIRQHMEDKGDLERLPEAAPDAKDPPQRDNESPADGSENTAADGGSPNQPSSEQTPPTSNRDNEPSTQQPAAGGDAPRPQDETPQPSRPQETAGNQGQDDAGQEGSRAADAAQGQPSDQAGSPGDQGDRHTDAATQADQPGPSPPDGKRPEGSQDGGDKSPPGERPRPAEGDQAESSQDANQTDRRPSQNSQGSDDAADQPTEGEPSSAAESGDKNSSSSGQQPSDPPQPGSEGGKPAAGEQGNQPRRSDGESQSSSSAEADEPSQSSQPGSKSGTQGMGVPGSQSNSVDADADGEGAGEGQGSGDDANLEYTREVTDLVLDYLEDQKRNPDPELLEKLGWKQDDLKQFLQRWNQLKQQASGPDVEPQQGQRQLDDVLRNLKLRPPQGSSRASRARNDNQRNSRNTGRTTRVPDELLDPFRAFQRSLRGRP